MRKFFHHHDHARHHVIGKRFGDRRAELGDGNLVEFDVYVVRVRWRRENREVLALEAKARPLAGMSLLWGSRVGFDAQEGGTVTIEAIS